MALEEQSYLDSAAWRPAYAAIEVLMSNLVLKDGQEISRVNHRHVVEATQEDLSGEHPDVQDIAEVFAEQRATKAQEILQKQAEESGEPVPTPQRKKTARK